MRVLAAMVRSFAGGLVVLSVCVCGLIVLNMASFGSIELQRLREPTLILWLCLLTVILLRSDWRKSWGRWTSSVESWFESPRAFLTIVTVGGVLLTASSLTHHLAFNTYSHDLGMYQEVLARAWERPPLASTILGSSFLGEHFSPVLFLIAPIYQLAPSPLTLVVLNALFLWVGVFPLEAVGRELGLKPSVKNLICLVYLFFPTVARAAGYPFHHEVIYPVVLIGLYLAFLRDNKLLGALLVLAAVAIKEDAGLYLLGVGVFFGLHHRRWRWGAAVAGAGALSTIAAVLWIIPTFVSDTAGYGFHGRWEPWFDPVDSTPAVRKLLTALFTEDVITVIAATLLVPLRGRWTWTVVAIPFLLNLTSSTPIQAQLGLYYGLPFAATAAIASAAALAEAPYERRRGLRFAAAAVVINIAALTYPSIPTCRGEVLAELDRIEPTATLAMSGSFDPLLQHLEYRELIQADHIPRTDLVLLRTDRFTWPVGERQVSETERLIGRSRAFRERFRCDGFVIYERSVALRKKSRQSLDETR